MSCEVLDKLNLCPVNGKCDKENCSWGASLMSLLVSSRLPAVQFGRTKLIPDECDEPAYYRIAEISDTIRDRVNATDEKKNIFICGETTGNGKTSLAIKLLQNYFVEIAGSSYMDPEQNIFHGCFVPTNQFIHDAKQFGRPVYERYETLADIADKADFTIFDDLGAAEYTKYDYSTLYVSIDRRIFANKFCVFTSNFTNADDLAEAIGKRLADRIWRTSEIIEIKGDGMRC